MGLKRVLTCGDSLPEPAQHGRPIGTHSRREITRSLQIIARKTQGVKSGARRNPSKPVVPSHERFRKIEQRKIAGSCKVRTRPENILPIRVEFGYDHLRKILIGKQTDLGWNRICLRGNCHQWLP